MHIREFQDMMRWIYFHRDSKRAVVRTFNWFVKEVEELRGALKEKNNKAIGEEFADVLAWLASLANVVNIDLEKVTIRKYNGMCPRCGQSPCKCPL